MVDVDRDDPLVARVDPLVAWVEPETLYAETAFVRFYRTEPLPTFKYTRWHALHLSPQAAMLIEH